MMSYIHIFSSVSSPIICVGVSLHVSFSNTRPIGICETINDEKQKEKRKEKKGEHEDLTWFGKLPTSTGTEKEDFHYVKIRVILYSASLQHFASFFPYVFSLKYETHTTTRPLGQPRQTHNLSGTTPSRRLAPEVRSFLLPHCQTS